MYQVVGSDAALRLKSQDWPESSAFVKSWGKKYAGAAEVAMHVDRTSDFSPASIRIPIPVKDY